MYIQEIFIEKFSFFTCKCSQEREQISSGDLYREMFPFFLHSELTRNTLNSFSTFLPGRINGQCKANSRKLSTLGLVLKPNLKRLGGGGGRNI